MISFHKGNTLLWHVQTRGNVLHMYEWDDCYYEHNITTMIETGSTLCVSTVLCFKLRTVDDAMKICVKAYRDTWM